MMAWLPYSVGCLISYAKQQPEVNELYEFMDPLCLAWNPKRYKTELLQADILGLTCYSWNQGYNDRLAAYYKCIRPDGVTIYGGPQVPENKQAREDWQSDRGAFLDHCIEGPGEIAFVEWLLDKPRSRTVLKELPTPYTDGIFDFMITLAKQNPGQLFGAPVESDRGCPYSCAFCDWGGNTRSKLIKFDQDTFMEQMDWVYSTNEVSEAFLSNANFGINKRDVEIMQSIAEMQKRYDRPDLVFGFGGLAKNGSKNVQPIMDIMLNEVNILQHNLKVSFQTHTPEVLKVIKRDNISNEKLMPLVRHWQSIGKQVSAEMIIGLPGETADSWLKGLDYMTHDLGIHTSSAFILQVTRNTLLDDPEYQKEYGISTKRVWWGKKQYGVDIVNASYSFDVEELVKMYDYNWVYNNFINTGLIPVDRLISLYDQTKIFFDNLDQMPLMKDLIERQRTLVRKIFKKGRDVYLTDEMEIRWFSASIRMDDLQIMEANRARALQELAVVFDLPDDVQFKIVDNGFRKIPVVK